MDSKKITQKKQGEFKLLNILVLVLIVLSVLSSLASLLFDIDTGDKGFQFMLLAITLKTLLVVTKNE